MLCTNCGNVIPRLEPRRGVAAQKYQSGQESMIGRGPAGQVLLFLLAGIVVFGLGEGAPAREDPLAGPVPAQVVSVLDGDTLEVRIRLWLGQELSTRVRLSGIDAPELTARCAEAKALARRARDFLAAQIEMSGGTGGTGSEVWLRDIRNGKYAGRVVARVETPDGADLGRGLIASGLARPYDGGRRRPWCDVAD